MNGPQVDLDQVSLQLAKAMESQPWYRKYSNTAVAGASALVMIVGMLIMAGVDLPPWVLAVYSIAVSLAGAGVIKKTPNGITDNLIQAVTEAGRDLLK